MYRYLLTLTLLGLLSIWHLQIANPPQLDMQWQLISGQPATEFAHIQYLYSSLPRVVMALLCGAVMGLVGSILQQLFQNPLVSPMTLGAASGAWLGVLVINMLTPSLVVTYGVWAAMAGALAAMMLVMTIAGRNGFRGLPVILAGMAVNLLLGAIASGLILLFDQYARNLFIWGAGDLAQTDWHWLQWLLPKLWPLPLLALLAVRPLTLLRLGDSTAQSRGMNLIPVMLALLLVCLWLTASVITAVGLIGFIGLITPNLARMLGARRVADEIWYSILLGALLLLLTDGLAVQFSQWSQDVVPSGAAAALVGAPALIWLAMKKLSTAEARTRQATASGRSLQPFPVIALILLLSTGIGLSLCLAPGLSGWQFGWPGELVLSLRWPRLLAALSAGVGLAIAGVILQRLIRNPLASPDILGLSAGATLTLVICATLFGGSIRDAGSGVALGGCLLILLVLFFLGRRHHYAPGILALMGISLAALLDAVVQFSLARGGQDTTAIVGWLAGSTYQVTASQSLWLLVTTLGISAISLFAHRLVTLISIGDDFAASRGLHVTKTRLGLLLLASMLCAQVTSVLGPIAFIGLLAPHMASMLGARKVISQLLLAAGFGALLMVVADWLGRVAIYPMQLPAGVLASVVGGSYFIWLLARRRLS